MAKPQQITSDNELFPIPFTILREWMGTAKPENHNYIEEFPSCYSNKFTCNEITLKVPDKHVARWRDLLPAVCQLKTGQNVDNGSLIVTWDGVTITLNQPNKLSDSDDDDDDDEPRDWGAPSALLVMTMQPSAAPR